MTARSPRPRHIASRLALLAALLLVPCSRAESPVYYFAERTFEIPFSMALDRTFRQLHLHASTDNGRNYARVSSTSKREGQFVYTAQSDGWYFFVVQVEEQDGSFSPARVGLTQPSMRVCVDTEKPVITLRAVVPQGGKRVAVEWSVRDPNLDLQTLRLEYRATGSSPWLPLSIRQLAWARFDWNPPGPGPFDVRVVVADKAKNQAEAVTQVRADPSRPGPVAGTGAAPAPPTDDRRVIHVNRRSFRLTYRIDRVGPSRVKYVEVWMTRDTTQWSKQPGNAPPEGPHEITVERPGRYGFTLRPISGVGRGPQPPGAGDLPQVWVEVDETPPTVTLHNVVVGEGADSGTITVNWRAEDRFLKDQPVTIYYATSAGPEAEWKVLQSGVENTGTCRCPTQGLPFEFFVRLEAMDRAGNKTYAQTRETVKVDLSEPTVTDVNVSIAEQANKPPR